MADDSEQLPKANEYMPLLQNDMLKPRSSKPTLRVTTESLNLPSPQTPSQELNPEYIKRIVRKIDWHILPLMFITLTSNFIDKVVLANASVYGMTEDISLGSNRLPLVSGIFYVGYLFWQYPSTILIQKFPVGTYAGLNILAWGVIVAATSTTGTYGHLLLFRFLTGALEASSKPAFLYITTMWYTREEAPQRVGVWFAGISCGGIIGNLLSFGIGHVSGTIKPWRWLYIAVGSLSFFWGIITLLFLPNNVSTARGFTMEEKYFIERRITNTSTGIIGSESDVWNMKEALLCFLDPKTWFFITIVLLSQIPLGGLQTYANLVLTGFGFTNLESSLIWIPVYLISILSVLSTGYLASTYKNITTLLTSFITLPCLAGFLMMLFGNNKYLTLAGFLLNSIGHAILPLTMSLITGNTRSVTQKMTMTALTFIMLSVGNIIGPQLYLDSAAPLYHITFKIIAILYCCGFFVSLGLRFYLDACNRRWNKEEEENRPATPIIRQSGVPSPDIAGEERSTNDSFRYRL